MDYQKESRSDSVSATKFLPHLTRFRLLTCITGVMGSGISTSAPGGVQPCVRAVGTALPPSIAPTGVRSPTCRLAGTKALFHLQVRRFFCRYAAGPRRIFAERFPTFVPVRARHSLGVRAALRHVGLAVGGRAGARLAHALGLPGSYRTILRLDPSSPLPALAAPRVIGLDEWAWRRGTALWDHRV